MVGKGGKKKTASSNKAVKVIDVAENTLAEAQSSHSPAVNVDEPNENGEFEDKVEMPVEKAENNGYEEMPDGVESEKATKVDNDGENILATEMNSDNKAESEQNTSEDDEIDDHEVLTWEEEEDDEENIADEDEVSEDDDDEYEVSAEEASEEEDDGDQGEGNGEKATEVAKGNETETKAKEDRTEAKKHDSDKEEAGLKNDKTPHKRIRRKKGPVGGPKKLESGDKPESSLKKKGKKKRVESMGMIFMCSSKTKDDCFKYRVFGLPESKKDIVEKIYGGMRLFLYDLDLKLMYGIYKAAGPGGYNIEPKAFKSQFPSQVRFTVLDDCLPLPEEEFKKVIKENYFTKTKFDCQLKSEQVKKLCKLFVASSKAHLSKKSRRLRKPEKPQPVRHEISKRRRVVDDRHQEPRFRERPHKRSRHQPLPAPLLSTAPLYAYERPPDRRDHQYNPYRDRDDPSPVTRRDPYRDGRNPYPEHGYPPYRDGRDLYVERRDPFRDGRDTYLRRDDPYVDGRVSFFERRDPYVDVRGSYLERRDPYSEPYGVGSYRRDPLLDRRDAYRDDGGGEYRDSFRREGVLERGDVAFDFETRYRPDVGSRDSYVLNRERPLYGDPIYAGEYPSRGGGLAREYRL
ncbi:b2 protein [Phtheirospermum japonicum]|uniref:B2 protein n=1 Tax=Phtheirospermum japonicum TaxID=374723 RepID=A0A830BEB8_9LAMI|nr:b2 protein [Phtheirospermum japonicum]